VYFFGTSKGQESTKCGSIPWGIVVITRVLYAKKQCNRVVNVKGGIAGYHYKSNVEHRLTQGLRELERNFKNEVVIDESTRCLGK
jgi:hypothetical protein